MKITGSGTISGADYNEEIQITGSGNINGRTRCTGLRVSGSVIANAGFECTGEIHVSGSGMFADVKADSVQVSGSFTADSLAVSGELISSGSCKIKETLTVNDANVSGSLSANEAKFRNAKISGRFDCEGDAEAEEFLISGPVFIKGLLNAEDVDIKLGFRKFTNVINSIGGTTIRIELREEAHRPFAKTVAKTIVKESIEGDAIFLENTECPLVVGKNVIIGEGCKIGKVQYTNNFSRDGSAEIGFIEKI